MNLAVWRSIPQPAVEVDDGGDGCGPRMGKLVSELKP